MEIKIVPPRGKGGLNIDDKPLARNKRKTSSREASRVGDEGSNQVKKGLCLSSSRTDEQRADRKGKEKARRPWNVDTGWTRTNDAENRDKRRTKGTRLSHAAPGENVCRGTYDSVRWQTKNR